MDNKLQPDDFKPEITTSWAFPERGKWATHNPKYRGNFAPQIPRNLIEMYSEEGDYILDPMVGSGTTLIEAKLLNRNALGVDVNPNAVELTKKALEFDFKTSSKQKVVQGDARDLSMLKDGTIDLIITHPPYLNIITYSDGQIAEDLSNISNIAKFMDEIGRVAEELFRVLKKDKYCAILMGDTRKAKHYIPLSYYLMQRFLDAGFILKEQIIKGQYNCTFSKRWENKAKEMKFYLIMHENLFVFRKPNETEDLSRLKWSRKV